MKSTLEDEGRVWVRNALSEFDLNLLEKASAIGSSAGSRLEWSKPLAKAAGITSKLTQLAQNIMTGAKPVRFIAFNKTPDTNWSLPWHQDRVIAVRNKVKTEGFTNWSNKSGVWHCEPPIEVLEKMMFARVHLDTATEMNGCLEVAIGSHKYGKVLSTDTKSIVAKLDKESCLAERGDVLFVKALTLHRSMKSSSNTSRKAIRIDYTNQDSLSPLEWEYSQ